MLKHPVTPADLRYLDIYLSQGEAGLRREAAVLIEQGYTVLKNTNMVLIVENPESGAIEAVESPPFLVYQWGFAITAFYNPLIPCNLKWLGIHELMRLRQEHDKPKNWYIDVQQRINRCTSWCSRREGYYSLLIPGLQLEDGTTLHLSFNASTFSFLDTYLEHVPVNPKRSQATLLSTVERLANRWLLRRCKRFNNAPWDRVLITIDAVEQTETQASVL